MKTQRRPAQPHDEKTPAAETAETENKGGEQGSTLESHEDERSETEKELERVEQLSLEVHRTASTAHENEVLRQRAASGHVNYDQVRDVREEAVKRVTTKAVINRGRGYYVRSALTTSDEHGNRLEVPVGFRLPEYMVTRFRQNKDKRGKTELQRLIDENVIEDYSGT